MKTKSFNKKENWNIEVISRAFILVNNKILLCRQLGRDYYFFPGGHVEFGESTKEALAREIKEELGVSIKNSSFIGAVDNIYNKNNQKHQEINLVFSAQIKKLDVLSKEDHIEFILKDLESFSKEKVLPIVLRDAIVEWLKNKQPFWREYKE